MVKPIVIDLTDPVEQMEWENLFSSVGWTKFRRIQENRIAEIKERAWLAFQDEKVKTRQVAEIEVLESFLDFEGDTKTAIAIERGQENGTSVEEDSYDA